LPPRFPRSGLTEIDQLSAALRQMHQELADRFDALRRASAESSALVDAMVEGVLASDERGRIVTANPAARRLLGYDETGSMPNLESLFRVKAAREVVDATLRGEAVQDRELDLGGRLLLVNSRPFPPGGCPGAARRDRARWLETVRRDCTTSHEFKTPLTSISGYAETLLSENLTRPPGGSSAHHSRHAAHPVAGRRPARPRGSNGPLATSAESRRGGRARDAWHRGPTAPLRPG
jgi:two-component system phosphate regulon sensor histidine kinase PhoR